MDWVELLLTVPVESADTASDIANMVVPYGIYVEDYSDLEQGAMEIAHIDMIDEELLAKNRDEAIIHIYISEEESAAEAMSFLKERYEAVGIPCKYETAGISETDWADNWKKFFKCTEIGKKLVIRPTWEEYDNKAGRAVLSIDPGAAFGTGTHATTRLCLELLEDYVKPDSHVLDIGCGSGILSIAGVLLGAEKAVGVDIDKVAVRVSNENAAENWVEGCTEFICGNLADKISGQFDLVCANIVADVIILLSSQVCDYLKPGGVFLCSGIIDLRIDEVRAVLDKAGFKILEEREQEKWYAFAAALK